MKNILFIIPNLATGGTNSSLEALYSSLKDKCEIRVFAMSHHPRNHHYSFDEVLLPQNRKLSLVFSNYSDQKGLMKLFALWYKIIRSLYKALGKDYLRVYGRKVVEKLEKNNHYDFVVAFQEGPATVFTSSFSNRNKIAWIHCNYDKYLPKGQSEEAIYNTYQKVVCVSKYTASVFANRYPALAERTLAIHNLIDADRVKKLAEEPIEDKRFIKKETTLLSLGRFSSVKRFREIPAIAAELKKRSMEFIWYVLGPGEGTEEAVTFINNVKKHKVDDCVKWLGGKSNPYPYFKASTIYVCVSETEACPMVFKEAQVFGLPIVTTAFPSSYEFVKKGGGIITPIERIADAIVAMVNQIKSGMFYSHVDDTDDQIVKQLVELFDA